MSYMGLDVGTSGAKAVAFDSGGNQIAQGSCEYPTIIPRDGWAELDSDEVLAACMVVIQDTASACADSDPVAAIGISSQGEAFTAVTADGEVLNNAMVSFDTRSAEIADTWSTQFGRWPLYELTGHTAHPMFTLFKLLWTRDNQPDVWEKADYFLCFEELVQQRLGLEPAISYPMAGRTMIFNVRTHDWDKHILMRAGIAPECLACPLPSGSVVGTIPDDRAADVGLGKGVVVVTGGHDQPCGALGAGVLAPGKAMYGMGTVECICPAFDRPVFSEELFESNLCTYDHVVDGMYTTVAFCLTGGNLLRWYRDEWAGDDVREARKQGRDPYDLILESMPDSPSKLMVLPHFTPTGTPYFDTAATGAILGLQLSTTRADVLRALLEGVTYEMKLNVDILDRAGVHIDEFIAIGGGAKNQRLVQLKADVLNRPITTVAVTEAGCLGVAMLAKAAVSGDSLDNIAAEWVRPQSVIEPDARRAAVYEEKLETYKKVYPALKSLR